MITNFFEKNKLTLLIISLAIILPLEISSFFSLHLPLSIELPLFLLIIFIFGKDVIKSGIRSLFRLDFSDINLLMTIATFGALFLQEFEESAIIIVLFALGNAFEEMGIERSQQALKNLIRKMPKTAQVKDRDEKTPIEEIQVGDIVIIKPGNSISLDGEIVFGESLIDEATITGESLPKNKRVGDIVYAGTINGSGYLEVRVTKESKDTTLAKIIDLTYQSAEKKSQSQKFIEKFASYYTPFVIFVAFLLVLIPVVFLGQPFNVWFESSLTLLLISCPCALVISIPVTIFSAIGNATKKGALVKGGRFIEEMGKVKAVAFDKTRTLTKGELRVQEIIPFNGFSEQDVLSCASGLELFSEHPLAKSVVMKAKELGLSSHAYTGFKDVPGKGLTGSCTICADAHHCLGTLEFIQEEQEIPDDVKKQVKEFEEQGKSTMIMTDNNTVKGIISVSDEIREDSKTTVSELLKLKITPIMLTGDNKTTADYVAQTLDITQVRAGLLPSEKVEELKKLIEKYRHVAMIGDGVNDAPALATASVGIAIGAVGSDVAIENSDIALMNDKLLLIPYLVKLGKKSVQKIKFNTGLAISVKLLFLVLATLGYSNLALAIFADVGVTVIVIVNSLTLYKD